MTTAAVLDQVDARLPGRRAVTASLLSRFGPRASLVEPLFVYGDAGVGKTAVTRSVLHAARLPFALVDCIEVYSPRLVLTMLARRLHASLRALGAKTLPATRDGPDLARMNDFAGELRSTLLPAAEQAQLGTVYLVLDNAQRLLDGDPALLAAMLRLDEMTGMGNVTPVFLSTIGLEHFRSAMGIREPILIFLRPYTKSEMKTIITADVRERQPELAAAVDVAKFVELVYDVVSDACRHLVEVRHIVLLLLPKYAEPVLDGAVEQADSVKLFSRIRPLLNPVLRRIYLRDLSADDLDEDSKTLAKASTSRGGANKSVIDYDLPFFSKYLLLASFLASYNPVKTDVRFFANVRARRQKRGNAGRKGTGKKAAISPLLLGPKPFPVDRMLAIFYSILAEDVQPVADLYIQIQSLVTLKLLTPMSKMNADNLPTLRFKCHISYEVASAMASHLNFPFLRYLHDGTR